MTQRKVILSELAAFDIADIVDFVLATRGAELAVSTNHQLDKVLESLEQFANRGRVVPELRARGIVVFRENFSPPYRIIYRVTDEEVRVVAVVDHRRDLDSLLHERARRPI